MLGSRRRCVSAVAGRISNTFVQDSTHNLRGLRFSVEVFAVMHLRSSLLPALPAALCLVLVIGGIPGTHGKVLRKCDFARAMEAHKESRSNIAMWTCLAQAESQMNTALVTTNSKNSTKYYGIFQVMSILELPSPQWPCYDRLTDFWLLLSPAATNSWTIVSGAGRRLEVESATWNVRNWSRTTYRNRSNALESGTWSMAGKTGLPSRRSASRSASRRACPIWGTAGTVSEAEPDDSRWKMRTGCNWKKTLSNNSKKSFNKWLNIILLDNGIIILIYLLTYKQQSHLEHIHTYAHIIKSNKTK